MSDEEKRIEMLLKKELQEDADRIIKEVEADKSLQDIALPADMDSLLKENIENYEEQRSALNKLSDADKEALRLGNEISLSDLD